MIYKIYYITYMDETGYGDAIASIPLFTKTSAKKIRNTLKETKNPAITYIRFEGLSIKQADNNTNIKY